MNFLDNGYVGYVNPTSRFSQTHGKPGNEALHQMEVAQLANEIVDKKLERFKDSIEKAITDYLNQSFEKMLAAFQQGQQYDCNVVASVAVDTAGEIFRKADVKKLISDQIYQQMKQAFDTIKITL